MLAARVSIEVAKFNGNSATFCPPTARCWKLHSYSPTVLSHAVGVLCFGEHLLLCMNSLAQNSNRKQVRLESTSSHITKVNDFKLLQSGARCCHVYGGQEFHLQHLHSGRFQSETFPIWISCVFSFPDCCCNLLLREGETCAGGSEKKILSTLALYCFGTLLVARLTALHYCLMKVESYLKHFI